MYTGVVRSAAAAHTVLVATVGSDQQGVAVATLLAIAVATCFLLAGCFGGSDARASRSGGDGGDAALVIAGPEGPTANEITIYDLDGSELRTITFPGEVFVVQVDYPGRVIAVVQHGGDIEPHVVDVTTGATESIGLFGDFSEYQYRGQLLPGSRWAIATRLTQDGGAVIVDLETMQTQDLPVASYNSDVRISPDDTMVALGADESGIEVVDATTLRRAQRFTTNAHEYRTIGFSPDSTHIAMTEIYRVSERPTEGGVEILSRVVVGDIETGDVVEVAVNVHARAWASDSALVVDIIEDESAAVVNVDTGEITASFPIAEWRVFETWQRPWQLISSGESVQVFELATGAEQSFTPTDALEINSSGLASPPQTNYVWLSVGGAIGAVDELGAGVVDLETGQFADFSIVAEDSYFAGLNFSYSHDGSRAIAPANGVSYLLRADGTFEELPEARSASFCDDDSFVLVGMNRQGAETKLFDADGLTAIMNFGPTGSAVCVN